MSTNRSFCPIKNFTIIQILYVCIILFGSLLRVYWAFNHFTHYDDIGLINCLIDDRINHRPFLHILDYGWTYGFLQMLLSRLFVSVNLPYNLNVFGGRLPSLLSGIASIFLVYYICRKYIFKDSKFKESLVLFVTSIFACSWENIIYSAQAEPYEIGVLVVLIIIIVCYKDTDDPKIPLLLVFLSVLAAYIQYTLIIPMAALYFSFFVFSDMKKRKSIILSGLSTVLFLLYYALSILNRDMMERGVNWNEGIGKRFLFKLPVAGMAEKLEYTFNFIIRNFICVIRNFFISNQFTPVVYVLTFAFIIFILLGFIYIHKKDIKIAVFIDFNIFAFMVLVFLGKITLGPSRHSLILYPIFLFLFSYGIKYAAESGKKIISVCIVLMGIMMSVVWLKSGFIEWENRKNMLLGTEYQFYMEKYQPQYIIAYQKTIGYILPQTESYEKVVGDWSGYNVYYNKSEKNGFIMYIGAGNDLTEGTMNEIRELPYFTDHHIELSHEFIDSYEKKYDTEIEYASSYYSNGKNGFHLYIAK